MRASPTPLDAPFRAVREVLDRDGFVVLPTFLPSERVAALLASLDTTASATALARQGDVFAIRDLLRAVPAIRELAECAELQPLVESVLGAECLAVRGLLFDKRPQANWKVPWHQDLTIAVQERREVDGFGPWSVKAGVPHVQPPVALLERMLTIRLHLDDCGEANGPLRVLPGSHRSGRLAAPEIMRWQQRVKPVTCVVPAGGLLLMRPLLLHASSAAREPRHRRVLHIEYAAESLPGGLQWWDGETEDGPGDAPVN